MGVPQVRALEDLGEDRGDARARKIVRDEEGHLAVLREPVLIGRDLHTAAEVASVGGRSKPYAIVFLGNSVDLYRGVHGIKIEEKTAKGDGGVIDRLFLFRALTVADLADVAVNAEADVVDEGILLAVDAYEGKVLDVFGKVKGLSPALEAEVVEEVVSASRTVIVDFLLDVKTPGVVDEVVEGAVAARENDDAIVVAGDEEVVVAAHGGNVNVAHLAVGEQGVERVRRRFSTSVVCQRIVKNTVILQGCILRNNSINIFYHELRDFASEI